LISRRGIIQNGEVSMGFYGHEPFTGARAYYVWTGVGGPGFFSIVVNGDAPNYTSGIQLTRDSHFVGGLKVDVMGWTGPLGPGTRPYSVRGTFPGMFVPKIVVQGSNQTLLVDVEEIPHLGVEQFLVEVHKAEIGQPVPAANS
jgi:hypothetical protein